MATDEHVRSGYALAQQMETLRGCADREGYKVIEEVQDFWQSEASLEHLRREFGEQGEDRA